MPTKVVSVFNWFIVALVLGLTMVARAEAEGTARSTGVAELFGLPLNDLSVARLEKQLNAMGLRSYPSYKDGVIS